MDGCCCSNLCLRLLQGCINVMFPCTAELAVQVDGLCLNGPCSMILRISPMVS